MSKEYAKKIVNNKLNTKVNNLYNKTFEASTLIQTNQYNTDRQNLEKKIDNVENKIPEISGLVTSTVHNTKIGKFENKISGLALLLFSVQKLEKKYLILVV